MQVDRFDCIRIKRAEESTDYREVFNTIIKFEPALIGLGREPYLSWLTDLLGRDNYKVFGRELPMDSLKKIFERAFEDTSFRSTVNIYINSTWQDQTGEKLLDSIPYLRIAADYPSLLQKSLIDWFDRLRYSFESSR